MTTNNSINFPVLDEDNLVSDSATSLATQQSLKAYADDNVYGSALETLGLITISGSPIKIAFTDLSTVYSMYIFYFSEWDTASPDKISIRTSTDNGTSYESNATAYYYSNRSYNLTGTPTESSSIIVTPVTPTSPSNFVIRVYNPAESSTATFVTGFGSTGDTEYFYSAGVRQAAEANNAIQFLSSAMSGGTILFKGLRA
jgi:hypothetical protein